LWGEFLLRVQLFCAKLKRMEKLPRTYLGVVLSAETRSFGYAAVGDGLNVLALGCGNLEDAAAYAAGQSSAMVAVHAARRPNLGLMDREQERENLQPALFAGRPANLRLAEWQLQQRGVTVQRTPAVLKDCPAWMRQGFAFYDQLERLGYQCYRLLDGVQAGATLLYFEVHCGAAFSALLKNVFAAGTLEGRLQRQLALVEQGMDLPDPMDFFEEVTRHRLLQGILPFEKVFAQQELDALCAAWLAWSAVHVPERLMAVGDEQEGLVYVPVVADQ
jgi:hypothetical protein